MNKLILMFIALCCMAGAISQSKSTKAKPVETFKETLYPSVGKESEGDPSSSSVLLKKYGVDFDCVKINQLSSGACVFSVTTDDGPMPAELHVKDSYPYMESSDKKYFITATYIKYIPNKKTLIAGATVVEFKVYRTK